VIMIKDIWGPYCSVDCKEYHVANNKYMMRHATRARFERWRLIRLASIYARAPLLQGLRVPLLERQAP
jgi:hypothetical protein